MGHACLAVGGLGFRSGGQRKSFMVALKRIAGCAYFLDRLTAPDFTCLFPQSTLFVGIFPFPLLSLCGPRDGQIQISATFTRGVDSLSFSILDGNQKREIQIQ